MTSSRILALATTALVSTLAFGASALAQSTGSTTVQELVVTSNRSQAIGGVVSQQDGPKTREIVAQPYISTQTPGGNALSDLVLIPGVNFTNDDPYGMSGSGGRFSIRGIKGAGIAELVDGVPLNDAGNYAIYPGELVDQEVIANINVITGSTDVDAPTSSSLGGLVNINTLTPTNEFGGFLQPSVGSWDFARIAGLINTGVIGPWGTKAWFEGSDQGYDKYTNQAPFKKWQINAKIYQPIGHDGDFIAIAGFYDIQNQQEWDGVNFASSGVTSGSNYHPVNTIGYNPHGLLSTPWNTDYSTTFTPPSSTSSNSSFQGLEQNPTDTGNIRGESRFTLLPNLKFTFDPSYQWVLANGGGSTNIKGTDPRLIGVGVTSSQSNYPACYSAAGVVTGLDLDGAVTAAGAPVCTDTSRLSSPSNTQTTRFTINTSLIWDFLPDQLIQLAYAYDHGHVRQTGEYAVLQPDGYPYSLFGGLQGYGTEIIAADGTPFQKRNRLTDAELDQVSAEYIGKFLDNHLRLDLGVRAPYYSRDLNQYCYTSPPSSVYCASSAAVALSQGYAVAPFTIHTHYSQPLPNVGLVWNFDAHNSVFFDFSQALNAPVNDDLYSIAVVANGTTGTTNAVGLDNVKPETTTTYELGYRFQAPKIKATFDIFKLNDNNHIVTSYNQFTQDSVDQNVGTVDFYGVEGIVAAEVLPHLNVIGSFAYNHSEDESNIPYSATLVIPTKGKQFTDTPPWTVGARVTYDLKDFTFGAQVIYEDKRYDTLVNDLQVPSFVVWNADVRWRLDWIKRGTYLQLNVINLFNAQYIGSLVDVTSSNNASLPYYGYSYADQGPPRTVELTLRATF